MRPFLRLALAVLLAFPAVAQAPEVQRFRQWVAGQELGGMESRISMEATGTKAEHREWINFTRLGMAIQQEIQETVLRHPDGSLHFTWRTLLSKEPLEGEADWSPLNPKELRVQAKGFEVKVIPMRSGALLWPGDIETRLKDAARLRRAVKVTSYSFPTQAWTELDLKPIAVSPLPGFPDAVRFQGEEMEGATRTKTDVWISPSRGDLKHTGELMGLSLLMQRAELPAPEGGGKNAENFFEQSLKSIPEHPFQPWLPEVTVRWEGAKPLTLPGDAQQRRLHENLYRLRRAAPPSPEEARDKPVKGKSSKEDAPFLAASPLVPFNDPAFDGLIVRMRVPPGATRWELAQLATDFVWEWITEKDYTVGFASALEVCRNPRGDCTEHGVLAVALLRKLGVPSRGVVGWVAAGGTLGLHFWVEVKLKSRWVPVDPTFDEAPASAFRMKLGTTDLADLGSVGWDGAGQVFGGGTWKVEEPSPLGSIKVNGEIVIAPDGTRLRLPDATWSLDDGLQLHRSGLSTRLSAKPRPYGAMLTGAEKLQAGKWKGWWLPQAKKLYVDLGDRRWIEVGPLEQKDSVDIMENLQVEGPGR